jgi:light-regulated signal transduction histidine kinase (bacteriophytochrome)
MGQLTDDLLSFSRLGRAALKTRIDMAEIVREVVAEQTVASPERARGIRVTEMPSVYGDESLIRQVLANLVSNAIKFTRNKEEPQIEIGGSGQIGEAVHHVNDNGVGFDMKYYRKIFLVFRRLHGQKDFEGTGVGLAIVARII